MLIRLLPHKQSANLTEQLLIQILQSIAEGVMASYEKWLWMLRLVVITDDPSSLTRTRRRFVVVNSILVVYVFLTCIRHGVPSIVVSNPSLSQKMAVYLN